MPGLLLQAVRSWKTARSVAILGALALAIGIGSATGIFSVVEAVLLKPLPYANVDRYLLVRAEWRRHPGAWTTFSYPDYRDYLARNRLLEAFGCFDTGSYNISFNGKPSRVGGAEMSAQLLPMLGVNPIRGQWFGPKDDNVVLISESLRRRLASRGEVIGNALTVNGSTYTVIGVMPSWFRFPPDEADVQVWVPLNPDPVARESRVNHYLYCLALPRPSISESQARADLQRVLEQLRAEQPASSNEPEIITTGALLPAIVSDIRPPLLLLLGAALSLLLITCANVASVLLARSVARGRETAVRMALGASTLQLAIQYFLEGLVVSLAGAALGALLAYGMVHFILALAADQIPRADQIAPDFRVVLFSLTVAMLASVVFSLAPLWQALRTQPNQALNEGVRSSASPASRRLLRFFVVAEMTLAFGLVAISAVLWQQITGLYRTHPGFDPDRLLVAHLYAPKAQYPTRADLQNYESRVWEAVSRIPGVESAGFSSQLPFEGWGSNTALQVEGRPEKPWAEVNGFNEQRFVTPNFFSLLKIPLLAGRYLDGNDQAGSVIPLVINQTLQRQEWPNQNPIGSYVKLLGWGSQRFQVVGVVGDVRNGGIARLPLPEFYISYRASASRRMQWAIRSHLSEEKLTPLVRRAVESVDPNQTIYSVDTMNHLISQSVSTEQLQSLLVSFFAVAALVLAVIGVYGVVSYTVRQRTTEVGTRMAVGANSRDILRLVMGEGLRMSFAGVVGGSILLLAVANLLAKWDAHLQVIDAWPFVSAALLIGALTLAASMFPAWRAAGLPPMVAIRNDAGSSWRDSRLHFRQLLERFSSSAPAVDCGERETELLAGIVAAGQQAESFHAAITAALAVICEKLQCQSAVLLSRPAPGYPYRAHHDPQISIPSGAFLVTRLAHLSSPLPLIEADLAAWEHWARANEQARLPEIATLRSLQPAIALPVLSQTEIIAVLLLSGAPKSGSFSAAASQLGLLLENGRLMDRIVDQERLRRELLMATEVQKRLFPQSPPQNAGIELAGFCLPARGVGGDYYDFLELDGRQIGVALADVAGKGIGAALIMSIVQASLRSLTETNHAAPAQLATSMNRLLHRSTGSSSYATFFYSEVDEASRRLRYVNAGHNPPMLLRGPAWDGSANSIEELNVGGTIIGMFAKSTYEDASVELRSGDVLLLFSDGVSEAHNPAEEEYGEERLGQLLRKVGSLPLAGMMAAVTEDLEKWMSKAPQHDDLTFVLMKVR